MLLRRQAWLALLVATVVLGVGAVALVKPPPSVKAVDLAGRSWVLVSGNPGSSALLANGVSGRIESQRGDDRLPDDLTYAGSSDQFTLLAGEKEAVLLSNGRKFTATVKPLPTDSKSILAGDTIWTVGDVVTRRAATDPSNAINVSVPGSPVKGADLVVDRDGVTWALRQDTANRIAVGLSERGSPRTVPVANDARTLVSIDGSAYAVSPDQTRPVGSGSTLTGAPNDALVPHVSEETRGVWAFAAGRTLKVSGSDWGKDERRIELPSKPQGILVWHGTIWLAFNKSIAKILPGSADLVDVPMLDGASFEGVDVHVESGRAWMISPTAAVSTGADGSVTQFLLTQDSFKLCVKTCQADDANQTTTSLAASTTSQAPEEATTSTTQTPLTLPPVVVTTAAPQSSSSTSRPTSSSTSSSTSISPTPSQDTGTTSTSTTTTTTTTISAATTTFSVSLKDEGGALVATGKVLDPGDCKVSDGTMSFEGIDGETGVSDLTSNPQSLTVIGSIKDAAPPSRAIQATLTACGASAQSDWWFNPNWPGTVGPILIDEAATVDTPINYSAGAVLPPGATVKVTPTITSKPSGDSGSSCEVAERTAPDVFDRSPLEVRGTCTFASEGQFILKFVPSICENCSAEKSVKATTSTMIEGPKNPNLDEFADITIDPDTEQTLTPPSATDDSGIGIPGSFQFSSDNDQVATVTVDTGIVEGVSPGDATITALFLPEDQNLWNTVTRSFKVTVSTPPPSN